VLDALIFLWAGYYGSQRTGRLTTSIVTAGATSLIGFTMFFVYAAISTPSLLLAPFEKPFIFVIVSILLMMAMGMVGGAVGRRSPARQRPRLT
jgi:hypothetical protein